MNRWKGGMKHLDRNDTYKLVDATLLLGDILTIDIMSSPFWMRHSNGDGDGEGRRSKVDTVIDLDEFEEW